MGSRRRTTRKAKSAPRAAKPRARTRPVTKNQPPGDRGPALETTSAVAAAGVDSPSLPRPASTRGKYVYCIIQAAASLKFGAIGLGADPAEVYTVHYKDIAAVTSDTPVEGQDATRENVLAHERVNETVMLSHTVIPMSFGTMFKTQDDIVELLRGAYEAFIDVLGKMQSKVEYGLKVLWDRDQAVRQVEQDDEEVRRLKSEIAAQKGPTYFARMQYGRLLESALQACSERYVNEIFDQLRDLCISSRANKPIGDRMMMNAAFLVSRDQEAAFDARVKELGSRYDKLTFRYTGPWPPYNFVNIRLRLERVTEVE